MRLDDLPYNASSTLELADIRGSLPSLAEAAASQPLTASHIVPGPYIPDGGFIYGMYDAATYSTARAARPYFTTDSKYTLTSWSRLRCMALARWAYINIPVVKALEDLLARLTVGTGFKPISKSSNKGIAKLYDAYYLSKAEAIDFRAGLSMDELLLHDCRASDVDGDLGYVLTEDEFGAEKIQLIEGHRILTGNVTDPRCRDGIWLDQYDRATAANVRLPGEEEKFTRISFRDFHYMAERNRPDESRSMTNLVHALNPLQDLYEIMAFATASTKRNAETANVIETLTPHDLPMTGPRGMTVRTAQSAASGNPAIPPSVVTYDQIYGTGGKTVVLRPGEKFTSYSHSHPAPTLEAWSEFIIRGICNGRGLPFEILWNPETIGGANTRMLTALLRAFLAQRRKFLIFPKLKRCRFWILARGIAAGILPYDAEALYQVAWQANFVDITTDAGKEARERRANVLCGLDTFTSHDAENGQDYLEQSLPDREVETVAQCETAERISKRFPWLDPASALSRIAQLSANAPAPTASGAAAEEEDSTGAVSAKGKSKAAAKE